MVWLMHHISFWRPFEAKRIRFPLYEACLTTEFDFAFAVRRFVHWVALKLNKVEVVSIDSLDAPFSPIIL